MRRLRLAGLLLAAWTAALPAAPAGTLRRGTAAEAPTLDPSIAAGTLAAPIINDLFEGLIGKDAALRPIPGVAASWSTSADGLTYTFRLKPGLQWSDGVPITADDVVFGFRRLVDPATASTLAGPFFVIAGARDIVAGKAPVASLGVRAVDPLTVEIRLAAPAPYFLELVGSLAVAPLPRHLIAQHPKDWTRPERMVSNGPYTLAERVPQNYTRLVANPRYHSAAAVRSAEVIWYPTQDLATSLRRFRAGELDSVLNFPPEELDWLRRNLPQTLKITPSLGVYYLLVNTQRPPLDDPRVRRALGLAVDQAGITDRLLRTGVRAATSLVGADFTGYPGVTPADAKLPLPERQKLARELLAAAGFGPGKPLTFEYVYDTNEENRKIAVALAAMWQAVGARAQVTNVDFGQLNRQVRTRNFAVARWVYFASYDDPYAMLSLVSAGNPNNYVGYANPAYDALLREANALQDRAARMQVLARAEAAMLADYPVIPVYDYVRRYLVAERVEGWEPSGRGPTPSRFLSVP
jgi:ABC-type oligopeptide transport system substrate-binding subunit